MNRGGERGEADWGGQASRYELYEVRPHQRLEAKLLRRRWMHYYKPNILMWPTWTSILTSLFWFSFFILILICPINCCNSFVNCLFYMFNALENLYTFRSHRTLSSNAGLHGGPHHKASKAGVFREVGWGVGPAVGTACWGALLCGVDSKPRSLNKIPFADWVVRGGVQSSKWHMRLSVFFSL